MLERKDDGAGFHYVKTFNMSFLTKNCKFSTI